MFKIGDKVNTIKGRKVYTITGQDVHGNYTTDAGPKFAGGYLRAVKQSEAAEFFRKAAAIEWEAK